MKDLDTSSSKAAPASLFDTALPMNRKERFFTGTVFPMIVCADEFRHFGRFLRLSRVGDRTIQVASAANIQFFTEYGFLTPPLLEPTRASHWSISGQRRSFLALATRGSYRVAGG
jgi:hypothetical protein